MKLKRNLNRLDVFCISAGAMLSGLFILPGLAYELAGPAILLSFMVAGLLALTGLFSQAELVSAMPKAGGTYFYITRSMGSGIGTVYGLITWFSLALKSAYELFFMATLISVVINMHIPLLAILLCLLFLGINLIGVKEAGKIQVYLVLVLFAILAYLCLRSYPAMDTHNFKPFSPYGLESVLSTAGFVFISFGGLLKVASVAEEVKNPGQTIPQSMLFSLVVIALTYIIVIFVVIAVLGTNLRGSTTPLSDMAAVTMGEPFGKIFLGIAMILAITTSANAGVMTASRYPLALARDEMLPEIYGRINRKFNTPHFSILITGLVIAVSVFVKIDVLVKAASSVLILTYIFSCLAVIILHESRVQNYQPQFKSVLYPWMQLLGIVGFMILLFEIGIEALLMTCLLVILGFVLYWFYGRKKTSKEFALLHLIERITAREITSHSLETELKEIIHERDEILKDRFDHLIEECTVIDIDKAMSIEEFFHRAAEGMATHLEQPSEELAQLFLAREKESSTVLSPFLAIPHIIINGEKHSDILLARNKEGFIFSEQASRVHTVFMLVGTRDERPFHLMSLAAIAQIVQDPDFEQRWTKAKNAEVLRDIVLLSKRKRQ